jgi:hypothetical protein
MKRFRTWSLNTEKLPQNGDHGLAEVKENARPGKKDGLLALRVRGTSAGVGGEKFWKVENSFLTR